MCLWWKWLHHRLYSYNTKGSRISRQLVGALLGGTLGGTRQGGSDTAEKSLPRCFHTLSDVILSFWPGGNQGPASRLAHSKGFTWFFKDVKLDPEVGENQQVQGSKESPR